MIGLKYQKVYTTTRTPPESTRFRPSRISQYTGQEESCCPRGLACYVHGTAYYLHHVQLFDQQERTIGDSILVLLLQ